MSPADQSAGDCGSSRLLRSQLDRRMRPRGRRQPPREFVGKTIGKMKDGMDANRLAEVRRFLETEHDRLAGEIADFEREGQDNLSEASGENNYRDHMADQGSATFSRELDLSLEDNIRSLLVQVDRAIDRIDEGVYGKCVRCGDQIGEARLEAMPTAELCISCKEWEEGR